MTATGKKPSRRYSNKGWRKKKTVTVSVPLANGTDEEGLKRLRWAVADYSFLVVPKTGKAELKLSFPKTPEGAASLEAFMRAFDEDEAVELGGKDLIAPKVEYPAWHRRIYGDFDGPVRIEINSSRSSLKLPVRVDLESPHGTASLPYVELRHVVQGRRRVVSNEEQDLPIQLRVEIVDKRAKPFLRLARLGRDVYEAQETAAVALVMAQAEVKVRLTALIKDRPTVVLRFDDVTDEEKLQRLREWKAFVDKLVFIQQRLTSQRILLPEDGVSHVDASAVERVFTILSRGTEQGSVSLSGAVALEERALRQRALRDGRAVVAIGEGEGEPIKFFNVVFEPGACRVVLVAPATFFAEYDRQSQAAQGKGKRSRVRLEQIPVVYEYLKWIPEEARWDRLAQLAMRQDGYATLSQARRTGYTDAVFLAMIPGGKIEQVAPDVFRLVHFPRADHEELIVLWLQTDRKGVISHDTALLLHELSDILPRRRHITVPPGWDPGDRQLGANVVLHHAEVGEDEIRWLGPVPYTAPLRTLRDCIASHLSPDLIEQAVAEGLQRGMFTEADLPPGARRGAA